jgi:His-Xaa-Ser system protein HxsD
MEFALSKTQNDHLFGFDQKTGNPTLVLNKEYFQRESVLKTLQLFSNKVLCEMLPKDEKSIKIEFVETQNKSVQIDKIPYEFYNHVIDQQIREDLMRANRDIQKDIYDCAFSRIFNKEKK